MGLVWNGDKILKRVETISTNALQITGKEMKADAKLRCPVITGFLKSTIFAKLIEPLRLHMGATADYAIYVELGTHKTPARPFIRPSFDKNKHELLTNMRNKL